MSTLTGIARGASASPFLYFGAHAPPDDPTNAITLWSGTLWIRATALASSTNLFLRSTFVGFKVDSGVIRWPSKIPSASGSTIQVSGDLEVDFSTTGSHATPSTPSGLTLRFPDSGTATVVSGGDAATVVLGTTISLGVTQGSKAVLSGSSNILFPLTTPNKALTVTKNTAKTMRFSGSDVAIKGTFWSPYSYHLLFVIGDKESEQEKLAKQVANDGYVRISLGPGLVATPTTYGYDSLKFGKADSNVSVGTSLLRVSWPTATFQRHSITMDRRSLLYASPKKSQSSAEFLMQDSNETWTVQAALEAQLDRPRTVENRRVFVKGDGTWTVSRPATGGRVAIQVRVVSATASDALAFRYTKDTYALKNLLLEMSPPTVAEIKGNLVANGIQSGTVTTEYHLLASNPVMPDPYASALKLRSAIPDPLNNQHYVSFGTVKVNAGWKLGSPTPVGITLPETAFDKAWTMKMPASEQNPAYRVQNEKALSYFENIVEKKVSRIVSDCRMLDLSTNASQLGLCTKLYLSEGEESQPAVSVKVDSLCWQAPLTDVGIWCLPVVEWEPILNPLPEPMYPAIYEFPDSGPATSLVTSSATLVPVTPGAVLGGIMQGPSTGFGAVAKVDAVFTLPFGIIGETQVLIPTGPGGAIPHPSITRVQPTFTLPSVSLKGVDNFSLRAAPLDTPAGSQPTKSGALPGAAIMLQYGKPRPISVLGYGARDFNDDFLPGKNPYTGATTGQNACVPVTRVDISGYGESMFSEWFDKTLPVLATTKADFDVVGGRALRELIQQQSELIFCGALVSRVITMTRLNSGMVVRTNVLKPVCDGLFTFHNSAIVSHPGLVLGYFNLRNIRDLPTQHFISGAADLTPVSFDADVCIESGSGSTMVPVVGHKGFLLISEDTAHPFGPDQYASLVRSRGSELGGPIDCVIQIPHSTLHMRLSWIEIAASTPPSGTPEFVLAVRGMPEVAGYGQFSFLRMVPDQAPEPLDDKGVPITRRRVSAESPDGNRPCYFAEAADLLKDTPSWDYCMLHTGDCHRALFPRLRIADDGQSEISSPVIPFIADPYALSLSTGLFPPRSLCLPFEPGGGVILSQMRPYRLKIDQGHIRLSLRPDKQENSFSGTVSSRVLLDGANSSTIVYTSESTVTLHIDSSSASSPWDFSMTNVAVATETGSAGAREEMLRVTGDVVSLPGQPASLPKSRMRFSGPLAPAEKLLSFLQNFGPLPDMDVVMGNENRHVTQNSYHGSMVFTIDKLITKLAGEKQPNPLEFIKTFVERFDGAVDVQFKSSSALHVFKVKFDVIVKIPVGPLLLMLTAFFNIEVRTDGGATASAASNRGLVEWGGGAGIGRDITFSGAFQARVYLLLTMSRITDTTTNSYGVSFAVSLTGHLELAKIVTVEIRFEAKGIEYAIECKETPKPPKNTLYHVIQVTIAVDVHIFWVLDFECELQYEDALKMNDGKCTLDEL